MRRLNVGCGSVQPPDWDNADVRYMGQQYSLNVLSSDGGYNFNRPREWAHDRATERALGGEHWTGSGEAQLEPYDYIVANHLLSCFSHHELIERVLPNLRSMLKPGGVLRVLVPDANKAVLAYLNGDAAFFPLGDDLPDPAERFCTFLPWFGESKSIFDVFYLHSIAMKGGFAWTDGEPRMARGSAVCRPGVSWFLPDSEITALDDRPVQSLIMEFQR